MALLVLWAPRGEPVVGQGSLQASCTVTKSFKGQGLGSVTQLLGGGFKYFLFQPLPGEMIQFD